jgi:hypothetical protein
MSKPEVTKPLETTELDTAQAEQVAGGDLCSAQDLLALTNSLTQAYENLVGFTSHVMERVIGN